MAYSVMLINLLNCFIFSGDGIIHGRYIKRNICTPSQYGQVSHGSSETKILNIKMIEMGFFEHQKHTFCLIDKKINFSCALLSRGL